MINRELKTVYVNSYTGQVDSYGQKRKDTPTSRSIEMVVKIYSQSNVNDVRYVDVTNIGLTKDREITTANTITIDNVIYNVLYVIPSSRYYQILMKRA